MLHEFRVMTFNIWVDGDAGHQPLSQTVKVIEAAMADVVGLQEAPENAAVIAERLGWRHVQLADDAAILTPHEIVSATPERLGARIRLGNGREVWVFSVHLPARPYQPYQLLGIAYGDAPFLETEAEAIAAAKAARGEKVRALLREVGEVAAQGLPVFVTGDFNEPSHRDWTQRAAKAGMHPMKVAFPTSLALERAGLVDAYRAVHADEVESPGFTWTPLTTPDDPEDHHDRIDIVYCLGEVEVRGVEIIGEDAQAADRVVTPYPSDHRAVVAAFGIGAAD